MSTYPASDSFHNSMLIWEKMINLTERSNSFLHYSPYPSSDPSSFHYPPATQYEGLFQSPSTMQNSCLQGDNPATVNNYLHTTNKLTFCEDVLGFRMDVCPRCLDLYSISIYEESEVTLENLKKIRSSIHNCSAEKLSKVMNMSCSKKKTEYMKLEDKLRPCIVNKVRDWLGDKELCLKAFRLQGNPITGCVHFAKTNEGDFGFIGRVIDNGHTTMQDDELIDFLLLSRYRCTVAYISIDSRPGTGKHSNSSQYAIFITKK